MTTANGSVEVPHHRYASILDARAAFRQGRNVIATVRDADGSITNSQQAIEIAYELQTGSYSSAAESDPENWRRYGVEIARHLRPVLRDGDVLLDGGTGELTSFVSALNHLERSTRPVAFDVSWSRLAEGRRFAARHLESGQTVETFVGDLAAIAMAENAVDVAMTVHALEPNGGRERELLRSLFRVARRHVVLFEPCYERASPAARRRMRSHGYVRGLSEAIADCGGRIVSLAEFEVPSNVLNPTWVFVVELEGARGSEAQIAMRTPLDAREVAYQCPITETPLQLAHGVMYSSASGLAYPIVADIPILRSDHAILATGLGAL